MRLIDADKLNKPVYAEDDNITGAGMSYAEMDGYNDAIDMMWDYISSAPTINATFLSDNQIDLLNKMLEYAVDYGGDLGGAYFDPMVLPQLLKKVNQFLILFDGDYNVSVIDNYICIVKVG